MSTEVTSAGKSVRTLTGQVVKIADGDTVTILVVGDQVRIRLFGIDAPERGQDYSRKSREALADLVFEKEVRVVVHDKDRYGRTVGDIIGAPGRLPAGTAAGGVDRSVIPRGIH